MNPRVCSHHNQAIRENKIVRWHPVAYRGRDGGVKVHYGKRNRNITQAARGEVCRVCGGALVATGIVHRPINGSTVRVQLKCEKDHPTVLRMVEEDGKYSIADDE